MNIKIVGTKAQVEALKLRPLGQNGFHTIYSGQKKVPILTAQHVRNDLLVKKVEHVYTMQSICNCTIVFTVSIHIMYET